MKQKILSYLSAECPWRDTLHWYSTLDSTNTKAKALAAAGAPHGTVVVADAQTSGRGRLGRSFSSPAGKGVYLSVIVRPACKPEALMHLTCAAGVAACKAVEAAAGFSPQLKWINDLIFEKKKLGGILTELSVNGKTGLVDYAIVGIGINCCQQMQDFPPELRSIATSLFAAGKAVSPALLTANLIQALCDMDLTNKPALMADYRTRCITLGQDVLVLQGDVKQYAHAVDLTDDGALVVRFSNGNTETVNAGEVSVRGMYGYV